MAHEAFSGGFIVGFHMESVHPGEDFFQNLLVDFFSQMAARILDDAVGPTGVKAGDDFPVPVFSKGELGLVPIMKRILHADDGLHGDLLKFADPFEVALDFSGLEGQLGLVAHGLDLAAAALAGHRAEGLYPVRGGCQHLHETGETVVLFHFHDLGPNPVADDRVLDKEGHSFKFSDAGAFFAEIFYGNFDQIIFFQNSVVLLTLESTKRL